MTPRPKVLMAFPYLSERLIAYFASRPDVDLLVDSGAFTAWKSGKPIALDDYCRFIERLPFKPWRYFMLDVIGDPAATLKNYETMLKRGFKPVPIFTRGEDVSVLEDFYKTSDLVAVGGLVKTYRNKGFVNGIMKRIAGRPVHWLGFTNITYLKRHRPYSADSSTLEYGARMGGVTIYLGGGLQVRVERKHISARGLSQPVQNGIRALGFSPMALASEEGWRGGKSAARLIGAASQARLAIDMERQVGTKLFAACSRIEIVQPFVDLHAQVLKLNPIRSVA